MSELVTEILRINKYPERYAITKAEGWHILVDMAGKEFVAPLLDTRSEQKELQVSLLNEIGLTLTAIAKEQVAQGVSMVTAFASYMQRLQNIADDRDRDHQLYRQMDERLNHIEANLEKSPSKPKHSRPTNSPSKGYRACWWIWTQR